MSFGAAIYARFSTENQSPRSIDDQVAVCRAYAARMGLAVVEVYSDSALSGFTTERPDYARLLEDARARRFAAIIVEDVSRLTRELGELTRLHTRLRLLGIEIHGVSDGIRTSDRQAKTLLAIHGLKNEWAVDESSYRTHRGLAGAEARGLSSGGRVYGYRTVRIEPGTDSTAARHVIEPVEADVVRRIFRDYAEGRSLKAIARALNAEGVAHPAKGTAKEYLRRGWGTSTIRWILRNERYLGVWTWNRTQFLKDPETGRRRPVRRPPAELLRQERPELRIVSQEAWDAVRERTRILRARFGDAAGTGRLVAGSAVSSRYLLTGILRCGECGARMVGISSERQKNGKRYRSGSYRCSFAMTRGPAICGHSTPYNQDALEAFLVEQLRAASTAEVAEEVARVLNERAAARHVVAEERPAELEQELADVRAEASHLLRFLAGGQSGLVREELGRVEARVRELEAEQAAAARRRPASLPTVRAEWVREQLSALAELLQTDPVRAKAAIARHLSGDIRISPRPSPTGELRGVLQGAASPGGLLALAGQEVLAGAVHCGGPITPAPRPEVFEESVAFKLPFSMPRARRGR